MARRAAERDSSRIDGDRVKPVQSAGTRQPSFVRPDRLWFLARLAANAVRSSRTFALTTQNDFGRAIALQADGKIVVAEQRRNGANPDFAAARLHTDTDGTPSNEAGWGAARILP